MSQHLSDFDTIFVQASLRAFDGKAIGVSADMNIKATQMDRLVVHADSNGGVE